MRVINPYLAILLCAAWSASAGAMDNFQFNLRSQKVEHTSAPKFWDLLLGRAKLDADLTVKVTDASTGQALAGAAVMVGTKLGDPFAENSVRTDGQGVAAFTHESLRQGHHYPVTVGKAGYSILSVVDNPDNVIEIALQKIPTEKDYGFLQGKVTGFPPGFDGGTLELGLFLPATRPEGLLNFDVNNFVSSYTVKVDVYGSRDIPGNIVLPTQSKRWGIFPINLSKTDYIMPLPMGLEAHMAAMVGSVAISPAVNAIQNKDYLSVLNMMTFNHVGWTSRRLTVNGDEKLDVNARYEVAPAALTSKVSNIPSNLDVISISLVDPEGDRGDFVAMDLKAVKAEEVKNGNTQFKLGNLRNRPSGADYYVFTGIFDRKQITTSDYRWIVASTKPVGSSRSRAEETRFSSFLRQMRPLGVGQSNHEYKFSSAAGAKVSPELTLVNIISEKQNSVIRGNARTVLWSAVIYGNPTQLNLPNIGRAVLPKPDSSKNEKFFWEVIAVKTRQPSNPAVDDLQSTLRNMEHVSSFTKAF